jgi:hypothetical protein
MMDDYIKQLAMTAASLEQQAAKLRALAVEMSKQVSVTTVEKSKHPATTITEVQGAWAAKNNGLIDSGKMPLPHQSRFDKAPPDIKHFENKADSQNRTFVRRDRPC